MDPGQVIYYNQKNVSRKTEIHSVIVISGATGGIGKAYAKAVNLELAVFL